METYTKLKAFIANPHYQAQREASLAELDLALVDAPLRGIVDGLNHLAYCFTLQACCGHFLYPGQLYEKNTEPLPLAGDVASVDYRIAYLALCIQEGEGGSALLADLAGLRSIAPSCVQVGCAEWFWARQVNSFVLQIGPEAHRGRDRIRIGYGEARGLEQVRNAVLAGLGELVKRHWRSG